MEDAKVAVECGVDGVDVVIGTSKQLREHSHKKSMDEIKESAIEVIQYIKRHVLPSWWRFGDWLTGNKLTMS